MAELYNPGEEMGFVLPPECVPGMAPKTPTKRWMCSLAQAHWIYSTVVLAGCKETLSAPWQRYCCTHKPYAPLYEALDAAPAQQGQLIKKFLNSYAKTVYKWGLSFISMPDDDGPYHPGNWCFEAALVVKLFTIDDSAFRDHPLYPAALIHGDPV